MARDGRTDPAGRSPGLLATGTARFPVRPGFAVRRAGTAPGAGALDGRFFTGARAGVRRWWRGSRAVLIGRPSPVQCWGALRGVLSGCLMAADLGLGLWPSCVSGGFRGGPIPGGNAFPRHHPRWLNSPPLPGGRERNRFFTRPGGPVYQGNVRENHGQQQNSACEELMAPHGETGIPRERVVRLHASVVFLGGHRWF